MEKLERIENVEKSIKRLLGLITPQGETNTDEVRYLNLVDTINVVDELIDDIIVVASYKFNSEHSMKKSGEKADKFITHLKEKLNQ